jgi:methanogenic corrinoid protein MtbC1
VDAPAADEFADEFFDALAAADEWRAVDIAVGLVGAGMPVQDVLLDLVGPAQERIGLLWQIGTWSVAREHAATLINDRVVSAVTRPGSGYGGRGHVVLSCLAGEWHALSARLVGEILRCNGWRVTFLGASVPSTQLVSYVQDQGPEVVALSCTMTMHLPGAHRTITAAQRSGTRVLAGGPGFGPDGRWARKLGVDGFAATAAAAVAVLEQGSWVTESATAPAEGETEYVALRDVRDLLVRDALRELVLSPGATGDPDSSESENIGQLVDVLAAAVYMGDRDLFADHLRWLDALLVGRTGSAAGVQSVLEVFAAGLHDFPTAQDCLEHGRAVLVAADAER